MLAEREGLLLARLAYHRDDLGVLGDRLTNGTGLYGPNRRLNATCCVGVSDWPRKNTTRGRARARRISATTSSASSAARSTPPITAPHAPVTGSTCTCRYGDPAGAAATGTSAASSTSLIIRPYALVQLASEG